VDIAFDVPFCRRSTSLRNDMPDRLERQDAAVFGFHCASAFRNCSLAFTPLAKNPAIRRFEGIYNQALSNI